MYVPLLRWKNAELLICMGNQHTIVLLFTFLGKFDSIYKHFLICQYDNEAQACAKGGDWGVKTGQAT